jgi:Reverse transcriptase (RNA-dependent DNA polymerase)
MPHIKQIMEELLGKELFTKLDICSGYHNVHIREEDRWKAAFKTRFSLYHPNIMLFRLINTPATFQHLSDKLLKPIKDKFPGVVHGYMDDYLIATRNDPLFHRIVHHSIFKQVRKHDMYLKLTKCEFKQTAVEYLEVYIKDSTICIDPLKRNGLKDWPRHLSTVKQVQSTLGVLGY